MTERSAWRRMPNLTAITHDSEADPDYAKALRKWRALLATTRKTVPTLRRYWAQTLRRRFAIESGEIEGIYRLRQDAKRRLEQEGFEHVQESDQVRITHPKERLRALLNDELAAIDAMREHAASGEALDIDAIRTWQATATAHQRERTVEVESDEGTVTRLRVPMIPGRLKTNENIIVHDGVEYEFCPPEQVETELAHVLACDDRHRSAAIATARCAAWLHAAFNNVHPFPDGNGRTGRLLCAWVYLRGDAHPPLITVEERPAYFAAMRSAHQGNLRPLEALLHESAAVMTEVALLEHADAKGKNGRDTKSPLAERVGKALTRTPHGRIVLSAEADGHWWARCCESESERTMEWIGQVPSPEALARAMADAGAIEGNAVHTTARRLHAEALREARLGVKR